MQYKSISYIFEERVFDSTSVSSDDYSYVLDRLGRPSNPLPLHHYITFEIMFKAKYSQSLVFSWVEEYCYNLEIPFPKQLKPKHWYKHIFPKNDYLNRLKVYNHKLGNPKVDYESIINDTIDEMLFYQSSSINSTNNGLLNYRNKCNFAINVVDLPKVDGYNLLINRGWYNKNNLLGVTKDHKVSIKNGYENKIPPYIMSHPANCEFMSLRENSSKNSTSSITIDELHERIRTWNK